jgi:hypothetical protein
MPTLPHSREATAAQRFVSASRRVDLAFRAVRGEAPEAAEPIDHSRAMLELDQALDELAKAQQLFDRIVGRLSSKHPN